MESPIKFEVKLASQYILRRARREDLLNKKNGLIPTTLEVGLNHFYLFIMLRYHGPERR